MPANHFKKFQHWCIDPLTLSYIQQTFSSTDFKSGELLFYVAWDCELHFWCGASDHRGSSHRCAQYVNKFSFFFHLHYCCGTLITHLSSSSCLINFCLDIGPLFPFTRQDFGTFIVIVCFLLMLPIISLYLAPDSVSIPGIYIPSAASMLTVSEMWFPFFCTRLDVYTNCMCYIILFIDITKEFSFDFLLSLSGDTHEHWTHYGGLFKWTCFDPCLKYLSTCTFLRIVFLYIQLFPVLYLVRKKNNVY